MAWGGTAAQNFVAQNPRPQRTRRPQHRVQLRRRPLVRHAPHHQRRQCRGASTGAASPIVAARPPTIIV